MGLMRGSLIKINQRDDLSLLLQPQGADSNEKTRRVIITVSDKDTPERIIRKAVSTYLIGYNIITLRNSGGQRLDSSIRSTIKDFTRKKLIGTEILSDLPNELTLQVLLSYTELSVKDALRRMSVIAANMHREALIALSDEEEHLINDVVSMDDEVDRFSFYIIRLLKVAVGDRQILKESGLNTPRQCLGYRLVTKSVERMADHAVNIAKNRLDLTVSVIEMELLEELRNLSNSAIAHFEEAVESFFNEDYEKADIVLDNVAKTLKMEASVVQKIIKYSPPEMGPSLRLILKSILRTAEYGADIAEIVLNLTVKESVHEV
jgi:phosphate uptake regulator